jgi:hypothetical protein
MRWTSRSAAVAGLLGALLGEGFLAAQELEPRTYAISPPGVNFIAFAYGYSSGNVFMDPALPIEGLDADVNSITMRYTRTFDLFGKPSKVKLALPWSAGDWQGLVEGEPGRRRDEGKADARLKLEVNFPIGAEVDSHAGQPRDTRTIVGTSLQMVLPTGDYDNTEFINLSSNRWTFRPEVGLSQVLGTRWTLEGAASAWLFTDNSDFLAGRTLSQRTLYVLKLHAIWSVRPGFWWAVGAGWGTGGQTSIDGVPRQTRQDNWRFALTAAYPLTRRQGVSISIGTGTTRKAGNDFDSIAVSYQFAWGDL